MKKAIIEKLAALLTAAFGLVAALAWNDTIKAIFAHFFDSTANIIGMIIYAIVVTIVAVVVIYYVGKAETKVNGKKEED
ncbi:hypothetical protein HOD38_02635 [archaeon]|jgi:hypothetical protein|nr:hypothetical protein [archaeon]MBT4397140.1 hypothetical protein [archaeon]MBT4441554.1 hypothetical protein [archaeon]